MKTNKNCQSCGMPLKKDSEGGKTEKDGIRSKMYRSYCYGNVEFKNPEMTVDEM